MSQDVFDVIDPAISGTELAEILNDFKDAIMSGLSGTTRPDELDQGGGWIDTTLDPASWSYKIWTGTADVEVFRINLTTNIASVALAVEEFAVKKVSADTAGAILKLVKQRIANNGQVLSGDTVGEIQLVGRGDDASNPVVAKMLFLASDDQTTSAFGGEYAFYSVADNTASLVKHMRFINGLIETLVPLKINSLRLGVQSVASAATIAALNADYTVVEMTGSTLTDIQGIEATDDSQEITIHNRASVNMTLKHQSGSASANNRLKLPGSLDYIIIPDASATLYYCATDTRWKLKSTAEKNFFGFTVETFYGAFNSWTAPSSVSNVRVRSYRKYPGLAPELGGAQDVYGQLYAWGLNANGQLGVGDVTPRSSPVAVLGGLMFVRQFGNTGIGGGVSGMSRYGIATTGALYAWGYNGQGQLGVGDVTPRSSPVAVSGGLRWSWVYGRENAAYGITTANVLYAWGLNTNGYLGLGDVTPRSAPTAVLGGLKVAKIIATSGAANNNAVAALTLTGAVYGFGLNTNGNLGVGDATPRSSPVAVVGGLTFADIAGGASNSRYFMAGINNAGAIYAWGDNSRGQLGVGDTTPRSSPVAVVGGFTFKQLIVHDKSETVYGLTSAGALYAWGENDQGQLGVGDAVARSSPVAVLGGIVFTKVRAYRKTVFGLTADGTLYAWGQNIDGMLGVGDVTSRSSPVAVLGGLKFFDVAIPEGWTDLYPVFGIQADGTMYAWGSNTNGTLGVGDVTRRSSPVAVLGGIRPDTTEPSFSGYLTVTPSQAYTINITAGVSAFGNVSLGQGIARVEVEYLQ